MQSIKRRISRIIMSTTVVTAALLGANPALARDLVVAIRTEPTSLDPHFDALTSNMQITQTVFTPLVCRDANMAPQPCLAESWTAEGNVWTFKLREGVQFSDGSLLTAQDVVFSLKRVPLVPNAPSPLTIYLQQITDVEAVDDLTVRITTTRPYPLVPNNLAGVPIMSATAGSGPAVEGKTTQQLNSGDGLVGTGPYRFVSWRRGAELVLERNPYYWGEAPEWDRVIYRPIGNPSARVAALQAGDVDLIEDPPVEDIARLQGLSDVNVTIKGPTYRLIFIGLDVFRDDTPGITGTDGRNPLQDRRVREAMSLAIDRQAIVGRLMNGIGTPAAQLAAYPMFGTSADLVNAPPADLERARALLAEAGYPNGFSLVFGSTNGRYMNDVKVAQALAAMWARIGIRVTVDALTPSVYFTKAQDHAYSAYLMGWGAGSGEMSNPLTAIVVTVDTAKGLGVTNYGRYSNARVDELVAEAGTELDSSRREQLLQEANRIAMEDFAVIPLQFEHSVWAMKSGITYPGRMDQMTMVGEVKASSQ